MQLSSSAARGIARRLAPHRGGPGMRQCCPAVGTTSNLNSPALASSPLSSRALSSRAPGRLVTLERLPADPRVAVVRLNDPARLNALTADMGEEFADIVRDLEGAGASDLGAVVLTGEGRAFSSGGVLDFLRDRTRDSPSRNAVVMRRFYERFLSVRRVPVPVVTALNGAAIGAGLAVALATDVRVTCESAKLGLTFVKLGLHPGMGCTHTLPRIVSSQHATRLLLTGDVVTGKEALDMGLVAACAPSPEACVEVAIEMARAMSDSSPSATRALTKTLRMQQDRGLEQALQREADAQAQSYASPDLANGIEAVAAKRAPVWAKPEDLSD